MADDQPEGNAGLLLQAEEGPYITPNPVIAQSRNSPANEAALTATYSLAYSFKDERANKEANISRTISKPKKSNVQTSTSIYANEIEERCNLRQMTCSAYVNETNQNKAQAKSSTSMNAVTQVNLHSKTSTYANSSMRNTRKENTSAYNNESNEEITTANAYENNTNGISTMNDTNVYEQI